MHVRNNAQRQLNLGRAKIVAPSMLLARSLTLLSLLLLAALGLALLKPTAGEEANPSLQEEASPPENDECWIFTHLQKSGGSTIKTILSETWGTKYFIYDSTRWKLGNKFLLSFARKFAKDHKWSVMTGGYPEALRHSPTLAENHCRWFTLFRHPISRLVSAYFYCRKCPGDVACASEVLNARNVDLITFAEHWGSFGVRQFALSLVDSDEVMAYARSPEGRAKLPQVPDVDKVSGWYLLKMYLDDKASAVGVDIPDIAMYDMLEPIQEMLRSDYAAVGILEEFNTTLSLFDAALDMPGVNWQSSFFEKGRVNVDHMFKAQEAAALEQAWTDPKVQKFIWLDLLLYSQAVAIFHDQVRSFGLD